MLSQRRWPAQKRQLRLCSSWAPRRTSSCKRSRGPPSPNKWSDDEPKFVRFGERIKKKPVKKEDKVSDAERKAMDAFMKKGKMKKLPPGKAAGYHGKSDPGSSMKGMISPADTKQFGTKKKVGSMK